MARLFDHFRALFSFGLALDAGVAPHLQGMPPDVAQNRFLELLGEARAAARADGATAEHIESASFAAVAWIDEIVARHAGSAAPVTPLQVRLFNSNNAHSEFFHHLSALRPGDADVREIYWHALAFGFKGQYYFENSDGGELGKLKALHAQQLSIQPLALDALPEERITPQPYGVADPQGPRDPERRERAMLRAGAALALFIPLVYLLWFLLADRRDATPTLAQRVEQRLQSYACADIAAVVGGDGTTRVSGFVSRPEDMPQVQQDVLGTPGIGAATFDLRLRVWPHCEVLAILKPYQTRNRDKHTGLRIAALTARDGRLREGDPVLMRVTNADFDGHLRVDYYTADGSVMHLNADQGRARTPAGEVIELGRDIPSSWLVGPPFGTVLVTVLSSPTPTGATAERPPFELASAYLQRLRESLAADEADGRVIADFVFLETVER